MLQVRVTEKITLLLPQKRNKAVFSFLRRKGISTSSTQHFGGYSWIRKLVVIMVLRAACLSKSLSRNALDPFLKVDQNLRT